MVCIALAYPPPPSSMLATPTHHRDCQTAASIICYSVCQVMMVTVNKALLTVFGFKEISFLLFTQNMGLGLVLGACYIGFGYRPRIGRDTFVASIPLCILYVCYLSTGLQALDRLSVPIYTLLKNSCPVFISVGENVLNSTQHHRDVILSLFVILAGVTVGQDASGSWASRTGLFWMFLHMYFNVFYAVYAREFMARWGPSKQDSLACSCVVSAPLYALMITYFSEWEASYNQMRALYTLHGSWFIVTFSTSACMGACLTFSIFWLCQRTSALTLAVVGSFNKVPIVIMSLLLFAGTLSMRNTVGLLIVFIGSLCYARGMYLHPPKAVKTRWTVANIGVTCVILLFIGASLMTILFPSSDAQELLRTRAAALHKSTSHHAGYAPQNSTLIVRYPGNANVSTLEFVSRYLPSLEAVVKKSHKAYKRLRLPLKSDPLRVGEAKPILIVSDQFSPLLHPELLPYVGSIFAEVLVEQGSDRPLLRVVRYPNWVTLLTTFTFSSDVVINRREDASAFLPSDHWNVLVMTSAITLPPAHASLHYLAIDASTAYCTPILPSELYYLGHNLCEGQRRRHSQSRPADAAAAAAAAAAATASGGGRRRRSGEDRLGMASVGVLFPEGGARQPPGIRFSRRPDVVLVRGSRDEWVKYGSESPDPAAPPPGQLAMLQRGWCSAQLDPEAKWPGGLRPIQSRRAALTEAELRARRNGTRGRDVPHTVKEWLDHQSVATEKREELAKCPMESSFEDNTMAELGGARGGQGTGGAQVTQADWEAVLFFVCAAVVSAVMLVAYALRKQCQGHQPSRIPRTPQASAMANSDRITV